MKYSRLTDFDGRGLQARFTRAGRGTRPSQAGRRSRGDLIEPTVSRLVAVTVHVVPFGAGADRCIRSDRRTLQQRVSGKQRDKALISKPQSNSSHQSVTPAKVFNSLPSQLGRSEDAHLHLAAEPVPFHLNVIFERDLHRLHHFEIELQSVARDGAGKGLLAFGAAQVTLQRIAVGFEMPHHFLRAHGR